MDEFKKVLSILDQAKVLGSRTLDNGTQLIGPAPHVAPFAWLHQVFAPLTKEEIEMVERQSKEPRSKLRGISEVAAAVPSGGAFSLGD